MPRNYDTTEHDGGTELQPFSQTTSMRRPRQSKSGSERNDQSPGSTISESTRTRESRAETIPETWTKMTYALKTLMQDFKHQSVRLQSAASTQGGEHRPIDHKVRKEVEDWLDASLASTRNCSQPTFPTVTPTIRRYLTARMNSRVRDTRKDARLVLDELTARETADGVMTKGNARAGRRESDRVRVEEVIQCWAGSV